MYRSNIQTALLLLLPVVDLANSQSSPEPGATCSILAADHPDLVIFPQDDFYKTINEDYWSAENWLGPACIFTPTSTDLVSYAIKTLSKSGVPFAVRGSGTMPVPGAANINSTGILLSTANLTTLQISDDHSTVAIGAGIDWTGAYKYLDTFGLSIVGSRLGVAGVVGCLLGGCMSFLSNEYGWGSATVVSYEAVLSNGSIVTATPKNEHSDLYWALGGGGKNFAVVTRVDMQTIDLPVVSLGRATYTRDGGDVGKAIIKAFYDYAHGGAYDVQSFVLPSLSYIPAAGENLMYQVDMYYKGNNTTPGALANFTSSTLTPTGNSMAPRTMSNWIAESDKDIDSIHGQTFRFYNVVLRADLDAMNTLFDIFLTNVKAVGPNIKNFISTLSLNTLTESYILASRGPSPSGDPMGIETGGEVYLCTEMSLGYADLNDTPAIAALHAKLQSEVQEKLGSSVNQFLFLNHAGGFQNPFAIGYNKDNIARLKQIRDKYDPALLYTDKLAGPFKLN